MFPSLNVINGETCPYISKGVLRHNHYSSYPKLGQGVVVVRRIPCSFQACTTQSSLPLDFKVKYSCNQPIYGVVFISSTL